MKKVKKQDLEHMMWECYLNIVYPDVQTMNARDQLSTMIWVDVNSIRINVNDKNNFNSKKHQMECLENFASHIEALSFGNLKVINKECKEKENSYYTFIQIACAYEVV